MVSEKDLRAYALLSRLPFPKSYLARIFVAVLMVAHLPWIVLWPYVVIY